MSLQTHQEGRETVLRRYEARIDGWRPKTSATSRNARRHWADVGQSDSVARWQVLAALKDTDWPWRLPGGGAGWRVTIVVYVGRGPLPDSDNLVTACKAFRDALAARLGVDDGPRGPEWVVRAERGPDAVELLLEEVS